MTKTRNCIIRTIVLLVVLYTPAELFAYKDQSEPSDTVKIPEAALFLSEYIAIPSVSGNENEAAYFLARKCEAAGLHVHFISDDPGSVNFAASIYPLSSGKPNIIFQNHIDVVPAGDTSFWRFPPFEGRIAEGRVWGRGALDNKGLAVVQFFAIKSILDMAKETELPYNVTLLSVSGEETSSSTGAMIVAKNFKEVFNPAVVIGEGGSGMENLSIAPKVKQIFGISIAEKEHLWLKLTWRTDKAGHTSIAEDNNSTLLFVNGLNKLLNTPMPIIITPESELMMKSLGREVGGIIGRVMNNPDGKIFQKFVKKYAAENPELGDLFTNKITLSGVSSNNQSMNQNSSEVNAYLDCRLLPGVTADDMISYICSLINDPEMTVSVVSLGKGGGVGTMPEFFFDKISDAIKYEFQGAAVIPMLFPASADNVFFRQEGVPVYGINPFIVDYEQINAIHNYNEFIDIEDLERGISVFSFFLKDLLITSEEE